MNRPNVERSYQAFYRERGFTTEEAQRFTELILNAQDRGSELLKQAMARSDDRSASTLKIADEVVQEQGLKERLATIQGAFGEGVASAFQRYQETMPVRTLANQVASALFYSEAPLSVAQAEKLVEIMGRNARTAAGKLVPAAIDKERALAEAQSVLSAPQLEALAAQIDQAKRRTNGGQVSQ